MEQRTIYVGNVTSTVDESALRSVFDNCGTVTSVRIAGKPGYQTFFCFVEFSDARAAKTALAMDGLLVGDRNIKVSLAKSNSMGGSGGGGGGTSSNSRPPATQPAASAYTPPQYPGYPAAAYAPPPGYSSYAPPAYPGYGPMPGYPVAGYSSPYGPAHHYPAAPTAVTSRHAAVASYTNSVARKRPNEQQDPERVARTVYVEHLGAGFDEQAVAAYFDAVGRVTAVRIDRKPDKTGMPRNVTWVEFETQGAAHDACELTGQQVNGAAIRVLPSKSAIVSNGLIRTDRPPGTEAGPAPATATAANPAETVGAAAAQHMAAAARTERARPADSTSSSERAADLDEAPPGTAKPADTELESRRMGAAALMQHDWQQAGDAPEIETAQADGPEQHQESESGHGGANGFAEGHSPGDRRDCEDADNVHAQTATDEEPAAKRTKVGD